MSVVLGVGLAAAVGAGLYFGSGIFSKDASVLHLISIGVPVILIHDLHLSINNLRYTYIY